MPPHPSDGLRQALTILSGEAAEIDWNVPDNFDPNHLLDALKAKMQINNDEALAHKLQVIHPIVRMIREEKLAMSPAMLLLWVQEATAIKLPELCALMEQTAPRT